MLDVTYFVANDLSHSRDSPEMQYLLQEHYRNYLTQPGSFFYNANAQTPEDHLVQCMYFLSATSFDLHIKQVMQQNIPVKYSDFRVVSNDLNTYLDIGLVVSTLELILVE